MNQRKSSIRRAALKRILEIPFVENPVRGSAATFLWGPRQTGKTTLLKEQFPRARWYDLLDSRKAAELAVRPSVLTEEVRASRPATVVIDEIQKIPALLDEVHWLLENTSTRFVLCGSSARKLRREARNLLGGRAINCSLFPLVSKEIGEADLSRILNHGTLPPHYLMDDPRLALRAYVDNYLKEEILDEAVTRHVPAFAEFLKVLALSHGQQINYASIARETGVSASTVRNYFRVVEDTLLGFELPAYRRRVKRRLAETSKFYLFDPGVALALHPERDQVVSGTSAFGVQLEHFVLNEVRAYLGYSRREVPLSFWRTASGFEVDLIVGNVDLAVEVKATKRIRPQELKGIRAFLDEHKPARTLVVSLVDEARTTDEGIEVLPWQSFCQSLWSGELF